ncbi:MAG: hypothetical protein B6U89_01450 [Desulfurococcales archaeon ex4484_58]|nr:MAG: hypothetical protein B6U89_01450 [Desulfurococcales archaeon ex4484_58]
MRDVRRIEYALNFFVKRIRDRLYVYEGVKGKERYIGSLDEIVLSYSARNVQIIISDKNTIRKLKLLAKYIAMELDIINGNKQDQ